MEYMISEKKFNELCAQFGSDKYVNHQRLGQFLINNLSGPDRGFRVIDPEVFYCEDDAKASDLFYSRYVLCDPEYAANWTTHVKEQGWTTVDIDAIMRRIVAVRFHTFGTKTTVNVLLDNGLIESGESKPIDARAYNSEVGRYWAWKDLVGNLCKIQVCYEAERLKSLGLVDLTSLVTKL